MCSAGVPAAITCEMAIQMSTATASAPTADPPTMREFHDLGTLIPPRRSYPRSGAVANACLCLLRAPAHALKHSCQRRDDARVQLASAGRVQGRERRGAMLGG